MNITRAHVFFDRQKMHVEADGEERRFTILAIRNACLPDAVMYVSNNVDLVAIVDRQKKDAEKAIGKPLDAATLKKLGINEECERSRQVEKRLDQIVPGQWNDVWEDLAVGRLGIPDIVGRYWAHMEQELPHG